MAYDPQQRPSLLSVAQRTYLLFRGPTEWAVSWTRVPAAGCSRLASAPRAPPGPLPPPR